LLHGVKWWFNVRFYSLLHSPDTWALHLALLQLATWHIQGMLKAGTRAAGHWIRQQTTVHHRRNLWAILNRISARAMASTQRAWSLRILWHGGKILQLGLIL